MKVITEMTFDQFAAEYCKRQDQTPAGLRAILKDQKNRYKPDGWMLLECQMLDSSKIGQYTVLPYGPDNTFKRIPDHPVSPRGLASDMSVVVAFMVADQV